MDGTLAAIRSVLLNRLPFRRISNRANDRRARGHHANLVRIEIATQPAGDIRWYLTINNCSTNRCWNSRMSNIADTAATAQRTQSIFFVALGMATAVPLLGLGFGIELFHRDTTNMLTALLPIIAATGVGHVAATAFFYADPDFGKLIREDRQRFPALAVSRDGRLLRGVLGQQRCMDGRLDAVLCLAALPLPAPKLWRHCLCRTKRRLRTIAQSNEPDAEPRRGRRCLRARRQARSALRLRGSMRFWFRCR